MYRIFLIIGMSSITLIGCKKTLQPSPYQEVTYKMSYVNMTGEELEISYWAWLENRSATLKTHTDTFSYWSYAHTINGYEYVKSVDDCLVCPDSIKIKMVNRDSCVTVRNGEGSNPIYNWDEAFEHTDSSSFVHLVFRITDIAIADADTCD